MFTFKKISATIREATLAMKDVAFPKLASKYSIIQSPR